MNPLASNETVDHHLDVVGMVFIEFDVVGKLPHLLIDAHPGEAFSHQAAEQFGVGAFFSANQWCQQLVAASLRQRQDLIDHLVDALGPDRAVALGAMGLTSTTEQQAQIVLDFGHRSHRGTGVVTGGFLIDRYGR